MGIMLISEDFRTNLPINIKSNNFIFPTVRDQRNELLWKSRAATPSLRTRVRCLTVVTQKCPKFLL